MYLLRKESVLVLLGSSGVESLSQSSRLLCCLTGINFALLSCKLSGMLPPPLPNSLARDFFPSDCPAQEVKLPQSCCHPPVAALV